MYDWIALATYLAGITVLGIWTATRVKDTADYFMGGRRYGKWYMAFFAFGAGTDSNDAVGVASKTYTNGMSGIWYQWLWLFATPFYWLIAPFFRRMRCITTGDYFEQRYDGSVAALYTVVAIAQVTINIGMLLLSGSKMVQAVSGGAIDYRVAAVTMAILFTAYGMAGGLNAAIVTDMIQGVLTVLLSFMLVPIALNAVGGMDGLRAAIDNPRFFSLVTPGEINGFHVLMASVVALVGVVTQPHVMGACAAGRTEYEGRFGYTVGNLLKRVCTVAWMLVGLCGIALYPQLTGSSAETSPDLVYGFMASDLLPQILPGLAGIFLASVIASVMSTCDAYMVAVSGLFTQNVYRRYVARERDERHYVFVGRAVALGVVALSFVFAFRMSSVPQALELFFKTQALMGAAFWVGLFWRRGTVAGAWAGTVAGWLVMALTSLAVCQPFWAEHMPQFMIWEGNLRFSYSVLFYLGTGFSVAVLISLITPRVPKARLDRLYDCLHTPVGKDEPHLPPFTLPPGTPPQAPDKLINHPDFEIPKPTVAGMGGFAAVWAAVLLLVLGVYWLARG